MTAKEYLSELQLMKIKIGQLKEQKQMYLDMAMSITAPISTVKVQSSSTVDRMADNVAKAASMDSAIETEIESFWYRQHEIIKQIQSLNNVHYIRLLFKIYVQGKTIKEASDEMGMTYQYIRGLHKKALMAFEEMYADILVG